MYFSSNSACLPLVFFTFDRIGCSCYCSVKKLTAIWALKIKLKKLFQRYICEKMSRSVRAETRQRAKDEKKHHVSNFTTRKWLVSVKTSLKRIAIFIFWAFFVYISFKFNFISSEWSADKKVCPSYHFTWNQYNYAFPSVITQTVRLI